MRKPLPLAYHNTTKEAALRFSTWSKRLPIVVLALSVLYAGTMLVWAHRADAYLVKLCCSDKEVKFQSPQIRWDGDFQDGQSYLGIFPSQTRQDLRDSAMQWDDIVTGASLNVDENLSQHDAWWNAIPFSQRGLPANDAGATVVHYDPSTGYMMWAVSYLNSEWTWNRTCSLNQRSKIADARVISTHEVGHWLTLEHDSSHTEAAMWADYTCKLESKTDDRNGANHLYP